MFFRRNGKFSKIHSTQKKYICKVFIVSKRGLGHFKWVSFNFCLKRANWLCAIWNSYVISIVIQFKLKITSLIRRQLNSRSGEWTISAKENDLRISYDSVSWKWKKKSNHDSWQRLNRLNGRTLSIGLAKLTTATETFIIQWGN